MLTWAAVLLGASYVSIRRDEPTVREQRDIEQAIPIVERTVGDLVAAAGPEVVVELGEQRLRTGCRVTLVRDGATLDAPVVLRTPAAEADALLERIADRLPASYRASVSRNADGGVRTLWVDAGEFVYARSESTAPGVLRLTVRTGCRPTSGESDRRTVPPLPPVAEDPARLLGVLGATDVAQVGLTVARCPGQGLLWTARSVGRGELTKPPGSVLPRPAGTVVVTDTPAMYAYRTGPISVVVTADDGRIEVATTSGC